MGQGEIMSRILVAPATTGYRRSDDIIRQLTTMCFDCRRDSEILLEREKKEGRGRGRGRGFNELVLAAPARTGRAS
jgi:hypothetical protein